MGAIEYGPRTALIVVDVQNDFADPSGSLYVEGGEDVIPFINEEASRARAAGAPVVFTQDWHPTDTPHFAKDGGVWPVHCVRDTWGAAFPEGLERGDDEQVIRKGVGGEDGYSGFSVRDPLTGTISDTALGDLLERRRVLRVVVVGLATDYCVGATALDACEYGFETTVLREGCRAVNIEAGDEEAAFAEMRAAGVTIV